MELANLHETVSLLNFGHFPWLVSYKLGLEDLRWLLESIEINQFKHGNCIVDRLSFDGAVNNAL